MENTYKKKAETVSFVDIPEIPQDRRAERAFLGSVLLQAEINYELMDILRPESFYFPNHQIIFEAMSALITRHEPIDMITLTSYLEDKKLLSHIGGKSAIADLVHEVPGAANIESYARIIQKKSILRRLISAASDIGRLGYEQTNDTDEILDEAEKKIFSIANSAGTHKYKFLGDELKEATERLVNLSKTGNELRGIPSGFKNLDNMLSGFQKSDLIILAARPSMGKTSLALDIARMAAVDHNIPVGIFSLEMSAQQLVDRMMSADSMVDSWKIRTGRVNMDDEFSKITSSLERLSKAPIYIDDQPGSTILKIRSTARRLKSEKNLQLIIIDYLQLIIPTITRTQDSMVQQVTEISRSLKNLARELNLPVIALSQLSRAVESRGGKPRLSDLRDSGCLAGDTLIIDAQTGMRHMIKDLASGKKQLEVFALNDQFRIEKHQAVRFFSSGIKQLFLLKTRSGRSIRASANHPFRTLACWKRLDRLSPDEHIAVPRAIEPMSPKEAFSQKETTLPADIRGEKLATTTTLLASKMCVELATSDVLWDSIVSIDPDGVEEVYDATVPDIHNFIANDIIVHNSIEQDADVVMFIHREDRYNQNSDKTNIAEILIEKHRNGPVGKVDLYFDEKKTSFVSVDKSHYGEFHEDVANF